jgi:putative ABC transport system permease protein
MTFLWLTIQVALRALSRNPLRAGLTMLGIIIGVGAMVAMVSLGQGAGASIQAQIASLGSNVVIVIPGATTVSGVRTGLGGVSTLTIEDAKDIERKVAGVTGVSYATRAVMQVVHDNKNWNTVILGATAKLPDIRNWPVARGTFFTQSDEDVANKVAIVGKTVVDNLYDAGEDVIGSIIRVKNVPLRVIGVMRPLGQNLMGQDQDDIVIIPFSTAERKVLGTKFLGTVGIILVAVARRGQIPGVVEEITDLLRTRHRLLPTQESDFTVRTQEDLAKAMAGATRTMSLMLLSIASISLLVGGIGIMNILLVSVTERTREIGIRMAVGAKRRHILLQFLIEAMILSTMGGLLGVVAGIGGARMLTIVAGWPTIVPLQAVVAALLFSTAVGVFFGMYPANKASHMNPIEALHYE